MNEFYVSGSLSNIIYSLPCVRAMKGGVLYVFDTHELIDGQKMTRDTLEPILSLIKYQPYIDDIVFTDQPKDHAMRNFKSNGGVIADKFLETLKLEWEERATKWLDVDYTISDYPVIFNRSLSCRNPKFPWKSICEKYKKDSIFIGTDIEYSDFCQYTESSIRYVKTNDLFQVARMIAGCKLFIGNQSCAFAIAEGLKHTALLEVDTENPDCCYCRINCGHGWDEYITLPEI